MANYHYKTTTNKIIHKTVDTIAMANSVRMPLSLLSKASMYNFFRYVRERNGLKVVSYLFAPILSRMIFDTIATITKNKKRT